ncbi:MAG: amino acid adenylation domain-containing protein [Deltaproteobacteria bacterium]|nr:amino acid adenylation domain-containing protein [Deltaproteobacteria bacterium]
MTRLISDYLADTAMRLPQNRALGCGDASMSFATVEALSNRISNLLVELGVEKGDRVGISWDKCNEYVATQYGVLKAGGCYVPMDVDYPLQRKLQIIEEAGVRVLFATRESYDELTQSSECPACLEHVVTLDAIEGAPAGCSLHSFAEVDAFEPSRQQRNCVLEGDLAYIMYTSGSTGKPKGVMLTQRNIISYCEWCADVFQLTPEDRTVNVAPFTFDISGTEIFNMAMAGSTMLMVPDQKRITTILATVQKEKATFISTVPTVLGTMVNNPRVFSRYDLSSLRIFVSGAAVCPPIFMKKLHEHLPHATLHNHYGPTEATIYCLYHVIDPATLNVDKPLPIGVPYENTEAYVVDSEGHEVPDGEQGELVLRGAHIAPGYFKNPEKTAAAFKPYRLLPHLNETVYHTGDLARRAEGVFHFLGRVDDMIKSRGYRIELNEIDLALSSLDEKLREFAAVALPDELLENKIIAAVVLKEEGTLEAEAIKDHCRARIPDYMVPDEVVFFEELPTTTSGKISKKEIVKRLQAEA